MDEATKRLDDSRTDFLAQFRKTKGVTLVDSAEMADITLEVVASARAGFGEQSTTLTRSPVDGAIIGSTTSDSRRPTVTIRLAAGDYETVISEGSMNWKLAAVECVRKVRRWIEDNRATVLAKRSGS